MRELGITRYEAKTRTRRKNKASRAAEIDVRRRKKALKRQNAARDAAYHARGGYSSEPDDPRTFHDYAIRKIFASLRSFILMTREKKFS